jgi:FtsH-binding integral membrane protein
MPSPQAYVAEGIAGVQVNAFVRRVYNWMVLGLAITGLLALLVSSNPAMIRSIAGNPIIFFGLIIGELILVVALSAGINRMQAATAMFLFFLYSALNGLTFSVIFVGYTQASIASTFFITAGTFGVMSLYGYTTKRDLTSWGSLFFMGLIGIIIASVVNIFFHSSAIYWVITYCGIFIFVGLTAYDSQRIKQMALGGFGDEQTEQKGAVIGALRLYLDFINMFLLFLRIFGRRR